MDVSHLRQQLARQPDSLSPIYIVAGDETLLVMETVDLLRQAARAAGYTDRTSLVVDARSDWSQIEASTRSISLFGDRQLLELKLPTGKPGKPGADALQRMAEQAGGQALPDALIILALPRLDKTLRDSKWLQALSHNGTLIEIPNVDLPRLPGWIGERLAAQNQSVDKDTRQWLAEKVEGNLLAAHQEILKLGLLFPEGELTAEQVQSAVLNVARYNIFGLRDAMLAGDPARVTRILDGLRAEGEALPLVLWAVGEEVRLLARLAQARAAGQDLNALLRKMRIFGDHERLARQALGRIPPRIWPAAVQHAHDIDRLIKGLRTEGRMQDPWEEMLRLALRLSLPARAG
ncbi:DNA polymerase III subunit delta [Kerstersia similis]|uniref:DNA polymerase III subunit delta n=1 Tax=Kerstersia similis TaxID=206505 RepID=UPI0039F068B2